MSFLRRAEPMSGISSALAVATSAICPSAMMTCCLDLMRRSPLSSGTHPMFFLSAARIAIALILRPRLCGPARLSPWSEHIGSGTEKPDPMRLDTRLPQELRDLTSAAKVNLCLVRRANRDGHVMRSFEIAAMGGCMLAEDTEEHREIFGEDGECVVYFRSPDEAAARAEELLCEPATRARIAAALRSRIVNGQHTYRRRLTSMLCAAHTPFSESALIAGDQASRSGQ